MPNRQKPDQDTTAKVMDEEDVEDETAEAEAEAVEEGNTEEGSGGHI